MSEQLFALAEEWRQAHTQAMGVPSRHPRERTDHTDNKYERPVHGDTYSERTLALYYQVSRQGSGYRFRLSQEADNGGNDLPDEGTYIDIRDHDGYRSLTMQSHRRFRSSRQIMDGINSDIVLTRQLHFEQRREESLKLTDTREITNFPYLTHPPVDLAISAQFEFLNTHNPARLDAIRLYLDSFQLSFLKGPHWQANFEPDFSFTVDPDSKQDLVDIGLSPNVPSLSLITTLPPLQSQTDFMLPTWSLEQWISQIKPDSAMHLNLRDPEIPMRLLIK